MAAASYEARTFGVRSAMPSVTAQRQCPELVFVRPRFDVYKAVSRQIRAIFADYTPLVEPLSLDEAYLDVTDEPARACRSATDIAARDPGADPRRTGLTASAGVSYNKFLAKLASDQRKPDGLFVITPEKGPAFVAGLAVANFHGVGPATRGEDEAARHPHRRRPQGAALAFLQEHFGKVRPLLPRHRPRRSTSAGACPTGRASRSARRRPSWRISAGRPRSRRAWPVLDEVWG